MKILHSRKHIAMYAATFLVVVPLLTPIIFGLLRLLRSGHLMVDYLMPGELYPFILLGEILLIGIVWKEQKKRTLSLWGVSLGLIFLLISLAYAVVSGAANSEMAFSGTNKVVISAGYGLFLCCQLFVAALAIRFSISGIRH